MAEVHFIYNAAKLAGQAMYYCSCGESFGGDDEKADRHWREHNQLLVSEKTEYALEMSGGSMQVRNDAEYIEDIYPLQRWLGHHVFQGYSVYRRRVIVIEDWQRIRVRDLRGSARATYNEMRARFPGRRRLPRG